MPKMKTKSSAKKRFRVTGSGHVKFGHANKRHGMIKRNSRMLRQSRGSALLKPMEEKRVLTYYLHD